MAVGRAAIGALGASLTAATIYLVAAPGPVVALQASAAVTVDEATPAAATAAAPSATAESRQVVAAAADAVATATDPPLPPIEIARWIDDLRDDGIPHNGTRALRRLMAAGAAAAPFLERALDAFDLQQRQLAAVVLRCNCGAPTPALLRVTVEALRRDAAAALVSTLAGSVSIGATRHLLGNTAAARPFLRQGLGQGDDQQRFLCAFLLAAGGHDDDRAIVARELVVHLADNDIDGDALMAAHGLYRMGEAGIAATALWRPHVDAQARSLLDLIALDLQAPPRDRGELRARRTRHAVTDVYHDPAIEFDAFRSRVATW